MDSRLTAHFSKLEKARCDLLDELSRHDPDSVQRKPMPEKWSPLEICAHLYEVEEGTLKYMQRKLMSGDLRETGFRSSLSSVALKIALKLPIRYSVPRVLSPSPKGMQLDSLRSSWDHCREEMLKCINQLSPHQCKGGIFRHPRAGIFNIFQVLEFLDDHFSRHRQQVLRLLKASYS